LKQPSAGRGPLPSSVEPGSAVVSHSRVPPRQSVPETVRLQYLRDLLVLDTPPETVFEEITRIAAQVTGAPIAAVSLIDEDRQWFKSIYGLDVSETPREVAFCAHTIRDDTLMEIPDALEDVRFRDNPLVTGAPGIRFYAGAPLALADGVRIGALCTIDTQPRLLEPWQREVLSALGRITVAALHQRREGITQALTARSWLEKELQSSNEELHGILDQLPAVVSYVDTERRIRYVNRRFRTPAGKATGKVIGSPIDSLLGEMVAAREAHHHEAALRGELQEFQRVVPGADQEVRYIGVHLVPDIRDGKVLGFYSLEIDETARTLGEHALARAAQRFRRLYEHTPALMCAVAADGRLMSASTRMLEWLGLSRDDLLGRHWEQFIEPAGGPNGAVLLEGGLERLPGQVRHASGDLMDVEISSAQEFDEHNQPYMLLVLEDVSDRNHYAVALAAESEQLQVTLACIADAVITTDLKGAVLFANKAAEQLLGQGLELMAGMPLAQMVQFARADGPVISWSLDTALRNCLHDGRPSTQAGLELLAQGQRSQRVVRFALAPVRRRDGTVLGSVMVLTDITEQHRLSREMLHRASHDALTGMFNRSEFEMRLADALQDTYVASQEHAVLYIDLDQFKVVNDICGHSAGDRLLVDVAAVFRRALRGTDIAARLGGDEFGVVLRNCGRELAQEVAESLCAQLNELRFEHDGRRFRVGASIGMVVLESNHWKSTAEVLKAADVSCYAAKEGGRNRVHVFREEDERLQQRRSDMDWVNRIEQALDDDRFTLFHQEIRGIATTGGRHVEILVRMLGERGEIILPGAFMGAAERFRLAARIDRWVISHVLEWMSQNLKALTGTERVAINLSGQSLDDHAFHDFIREVLARHESLCSRLCFEVTETSVVNNIREASRLLTDLRRIGCTVALDDFGSGASSFGYLKTLSVDYLNIDQQFVRNLAHDAIAQATVRCIREVAEAVGMFTIAEGIETQAVHERLVALGVHYGQGFHYHRPQPLAELLTPTL
jgi:diguanylate cyclase